MGLHHTARADSQCFTFVIFVNNNFNNDTYKIHECMKNSTVTYLRKESKFCSMKFQTQKCQINFIIISYLTISNVTTTILLPSSGYCWPGLHHTARGWFGKVTILHICNICKYLTIFQVCDWGTTCQASPFTFQLKVLIADKKSYQVTNMERLLCKFVFVVFLMEALMNAKTYAGGKKKS